MCEPKIAGGIAAPAERQQVAASRQLDRPRSDCGLHGRALVSYLDPAIRQLANALSPLLAAFQCRTNVRKKSMNANYGRPM